MSLITCAVIWLISGWICAAILIRLELQQGIDCTVGQLAVSFSVGTFAGPLLILAVFHYLNWDKVLIKAKKK